MLLIGRDLSPFVRRTATVLNLLGLHYERKAVNTVDDKEFIARHNPLGRVPALKLDDDDVLIDSHAIIDYLLDLADPDGLLLAKSGESRRRTMRQSAMATGVMEKGVACAYEVNQRPKEYVYEPYRVRIKAQLVEGLGELDEVVAGRDWLGETGPNLADVNAVVAFDFVNIVAPDTIQSGAFANLVALRERANALPEFAATKWQGG